MHPESLKTAGEVIDALGGSTAVGRLTGRNVQAVSNWKGFDRFPAKTFVTLQDALRKIGKEAPAWLWQMHEAEPEAEDAA